MKRLHRWILAGGIVAGFLGGLAACQDTMRRDRVAICRRALPAVATGAGVRFLGAGLGPAPGTARVDYNEGTRQHRLTCRFDGATKLLEVATDGAALSGPALYMLQRYYLDTPDAAEGDPAHR
ncbi:hypothetical protein [Methylobacterium persicinum]|uniref:DUF992 domain-containing protein n=1 Tax=Methylobacterium persicinum TaxID=374426 RepID=A0ABU0HKJ1_9HYPH|nr:hypothetical protein [Methylobacterium persicinum]MDQ0442046.1 hypothetical protein [Methylobacterium persicinum]GJE38855.1 hypothetical protein KHHGKMAE_2931 [Methylobacterium persicinum]